jgi:hypothetical protein
MGVKLDWEIEAERATYNNLGERSYDVRQRRANYRRTLLAILIVAGVVLTVVGLFLARLWYVDGTIERQLRDTIAAETAALRIGDFAAYLYVQRSGSDAWMQGQRELFWAYQQAKLEHTIDLTGQVLALEIDEYRARAAIEEIVDGERYQVLWFYWRYEDGWRHVPMDVTFWGGDATYEGQNVTVHYGRLDEALVEALIPGLERLWNQGCDWLACAAPPGPLTVQVMPDPAVGVSWSPDEAEVLRIASPLSGRARVDLPLEPALARQIGTLLARRLVDHARSDLNPAPAADAAFLQGALENWLVGRFLGDGGTLGSGFVESLVRVYGEQAVGVLAQNLQSDSSIAILATVFMTPLDVLPVDWREFFQWRLALEPFLLAQGNQAGVLALYDDLAQNEAQALFTDPSAATRPVLTVLRVVVGPGTDGGSRAWAVVQYPDGSEGPITFRLVDGVWRRSAPDAAYDSLPR